MIRRLIRYARYDMALWLVQLLTNWLPDNGPGIRFRGMLVSLCLGKCGRKLTVARDVTILVPERLEVGDNVYFARGCWINAIGTVRVEDEVMLGPYVVIASSTHGFRDGSCFRGGSHPAPVSIGWGSWLAAHVVVSAGARIGKGNLVAANAVVGGETPDNVMVGGVPARVIKERVDNPTEIVSRYDA